MEDREVALLKQEAQEFIESNWEAIVEDIASLVKIRSVENLAEATEEMPYGPEPYAALIKTVEIAQKLGLDAHNLGGHIAYADLKGTSDKQIALISHTDIVPEGSGWTTDPYTLTRKDGYLIGRGVIDDKGPMVISLYLAKFFKEKAEREGKTWPYTIRILIGNNEETEMRDVEWYLKRYPQPEFLFTSDADFPLICGEKGGFSATIISDKISDRIVSFVGGSAGNAVASLCRATIVADADKLTVHDKIDVTDNHDGTLSLLAHGKGAHASTPEGSINAIGLICDYLLENKVYSEAELEFLLLLQKVFATTDGSSLGIAATDEYFTPLTSIGGTIATTEDGRFEQTIDVRYPTSITGEELAAKVGDLAKKAGASLRVDLDMVPFVTDPESDAMRALVDTYNDFRGTSAEPYTIGGGTYARHFKAGGAFGPNDPTDPMPAWIGAEHSADEGFSEEGFKRALAIYIVSVAKLMELSF